jgi:hypothetical protein
MRAKKQKQNPKTKKKPKLASDKAKQGTKIVTTAIGPGLTERGVLLEDGMTQLGRATDALVERVATSARDGARDPAEHVLDISKAYYREESATGSHNIQCDRCLLKSPGASSVRAASKLAESLGWVVTDAYDHCPVCKDGSMLRSCGSGALAVVVPPRLSPSDMILIVRMRYVVDYISRGASVEAFLQNSVRSGHRSMLSDLAQESNYLTPPLIERVSILVGQRHADVHEFLVTDAAKVWAFFLKLYRLLLAEDSPF